MFVNEYCTRFKYTCVLFRRKHTVTLPARKFHKPSCTSCGPIGQIVCQIHDVPDSLPGLLEQMPLEPKKLGWLHLGGDLPSNKFEDRVAGSVDLICLLYCPVGADINRQRKQKHQDSR